MTSIRSCLRRFGSGQSGMTLVEVLVSALVMTVGLLGIYQGLSSEQAGTTYAERSAVLSQAGEQALQAVEALNYTNIADSSAPVKTTSTDKTNPTYYLSTCGANTCYQWDPSNSANAETVAVDAVNGAVSPGPTTGVVPAPNKSGCTTTTTTNCRFTYSIYRFVTNVTDALCSQTGVTCSTSTSYKRITIAVKNNNAGPPYNPVVLSTFVSSKAGGTSNPLTNSSTTTCLDGATTVACTH